MDLDLLNNLWQGKASITNKGLPLCESSTTLMHHACMNGDTRSVTRLSLCALVATAQVQVPLYIEGTRHLGAVYVFYQLFFFYNFNRFSVFTFSDHKWIKNYHSFSLESWEYWSLSRYKDSKPDFKYCTKGKTLKYFNEGYKQIELFHPVYRAWNNGESVNRRAKQLQFRSNL